MIPTRYIVFKTDGTEEVREILWPKEPSYLDIKDLITPLLDDALSEHVSVLFEGNRRDMFVDELGQLKNLPRNEAATAIYRANHLRAYGGDPEDLPDIAGTAILFPDRIIWT